MKTLVVLLLTVCDACIANASGSWLPSERAQTESVEIADFLESLSGSCRALACRYDGAGLVSATPFVAAKAEAAGAQWSCELRAAKAGDDAGTLDLTAVFKVVSGAAMQAGVAVAFDFSNWNTDNYILVPAVLYGGNRFRVLPLGYPPYIHNEKDRPLDMPITVTDIMRLNPDGSHAKVEMMTGNCSTPMMSFFNPAQKRGFILLAEQQSRFGNNGMFVEEEAKQSKAMTFAVTAPCVRERKYEMCIFRNSSDRAANWNAGDELTLHFKLITFPCDSIPAFFDRVFSSRKALTGANAYRQVAPYSHIAEVIVTHFDKEKWFENAKYGYYCNSTDNGHKYHNQMGWNGVPIYSYPAGLLRTPERDRRVGRSLDMLLETQGKTGLFYAMFQKGTIHSDTFDDNPATRAVSMTRRSADVVYWGLKQLDIFKRNGLPVKPEWEAMFRLACDGMVKVWNDYGQFGQFIDVDTGKMQINGSTAGIACSGALAFASEYFNEPKYLKVAEASGKLYYERDFTKGYAGGGAAEILQSPDYEQPYDGAEAYMVLYEVTGNPYWLGCAKLAIGHLATWAISYDYKFPKGTDHDRVGNRSTGAMFASSQNNCATPGFYIVSGDFLLRYYRATGDKRVAELYKDYAHNVIQYVNTKTNPLMGGDGGAHEGYVTERVQVSDWEGGQDIGLVHLGSNMAWETQVAVTCLENPGIHLNTTTGDLVVLDHVHVVIRKRDATGVTLEITNPTPYDARVSILAESPEQAKKPLSCTACLGWPKAEVKAGETKIVFVSLDGRVQIMGR